MIVILLTRVIKFKFLKVNVRIDDNRCKGFASCRVLNFNCWDFTLLGLVLPITKLHISSYKFILLLAYTLVRL